MSFVTRLGPFLAAVLLCLAATPARAQSSGKILFHSNESAGPYNIYTINPDGSNRTNLTNTPSSATGWQYYSTYAAWSPDNTKIAFDRGRQVYVMDADGSNVTQVTSHSASYLSTYTCPAWSPDGTKIAYLRGSGPDIYVVNVDGSGVTKLTSQAVSGTTTVGGGGMRIAWSPDGTKIAFTRSAGSTGTEIYVMDAGGEAGGTSPAARLTFLGKCASPDWSPDGTQIAFHKTDSTNSGILYVEYATGTVTRLTSTGGSFDLSPDWSPDGTQITFSASRGTGSPKIWTMNADGTGVTRITFPSGAPTEGYPDWN